jgi:hypothetical protein
VLKNYVKARERELDSIPRKTESPSSRTEIHTEESRTHTHTQRGKRAEELIQARETNKVAARASKGK